MINDYNAYVQQILSTGTGFSFFSQIMPEESPANALCLQEVGGNLNPDIAMFSGDFLFKIVSRGESQQVALTQGETVFQKIVKSPELFEKGDNPNIHIERLMPQSRPQFVGQDSRGRFLYSFNISAIIHDRTQ